MSPARRAVVVLNYRSAALLERHLGRTPLPDGVVVILVDNFSDQAERDRVVALAGHHRWVLVPLPDNGGFAVGVNAGVRAAIGRGCSSVLLLNPDAGASTDTIEALFATVEQDRSCLVAPQILDSAGGTYFAGSQVQLATGRIRGRRAAAASPLPDWQRQEWLTAACLAFSTDLWHRAGGFDENYFLYWEDVDFSLRCVRAGARLVLRTDLTAVHDEGGSQQRNDTRAKSALYYRYNCRNRLVFASHWLSGRGRLRWLLGTPRESWLILMRGGRRQLVRSPAPLAATLRGSAEGIGRLLVSFVEHRTR